MINYIKIPHLTPVKFYESKTDCGIHMDQDWAYNQIKSFERKVYYNRKWQRGDSTPIQIPATSLPGDIKVLDCYGVEKKSISFIEVINGGTIGYNIYQANINIDDLPDGVYYLYSTTATGTFTSVQNFDIASVDNGDGTTTYTISYDSFDTTVFVVLLQHRLLGSSDSFSGGGSGTRIGPIVVTLPTDDYEFRLMLLHHDISMPVTIVPYESMEAGSANLKIISEPIWLKDNHPNTLLFQYKNSFNDFDVVFTTGIEYKFRCEAGIMDFQPESEVTDYIDQTRNVEILNGVPYRLFKLYIGTAPGVAPYVADILNRIFCCDHVMISKDGTNAKQYVKPASSKWEPTRQKGYPYQGWATEIFEAVNLTSLQLTSDGDVELVTAYNIETGFFGLGEDVTITEIENTN